MRSEQSGGREAPTHKGGQLTNNRRTTTMSVAWSTTVRIREEQIIRLERRAGARPQGDPNYLMCDESGELSNNTA